VNVLNYVKRLNPDESVNWIVSETTESTGISKTYVFKIRSESVRNPLVIPNKRQSKWLRRNNREVKYDDFIRSSIRRIAVNWTRVGSNKTPHKMNNTSFKTKDMEQLIQQRLDSVTADRWTDCVDMWNALRADEIQDDIEPLIIKIGENSSSSDDSVDSDQGTNGEFNDHYMQGKAPLH
jgi:hypothetical protein